MSHYGRNNIYIVDRHYSLILKPWSARTLYFYAHADLAQKYSVALQEICVSSLCSQEENYFFLPCHQHPVVDINDQEISCLFFPIDVGSRSDSRRCRRLVKSCSQLCRTETICCCYTNGNIPLSLSGEGRRSGGGREEWKMEGVRKEYK